MILLTWSTAAIQVEEFLVYLPPVPGNLTFVQTFSSVNPAVPFSVICHFIQNWCASLHWLDFISSSSSCINSINWSLITSASKNPALSQMKFLIYRALHQLFEIIINSGCATDYTNPAHFNYVPCGVITSDGKWVVVVDLSAKAFFRERHNTAADDLSLSIDTLRETSSMTKDNWKTSPLGNWTWGASIQRTISSPSLLFVV